MTFTDEQLAALRAAGLTDPNVAVLASLVAAGGPHALPALSAAAEQLLGTAEASPAVVAAAHVLGDVADTLRAADATAAPPPQRAPLAELTPRNPPVTDRPTATTMVVTAGGAPVGDRAALAAAFADALQKGWQVRHREAAPTRGPPARPERTPQQ